MKTFLGTLALTSCAFAQVDAIQQSHLKADLTFLASDAMKGRMSLDSTDDIAAEWLVSEFTKAGLKPAAGNSFVQKVPIIEYRINRAATALSLKHSGVATQFKAPDITGGFFNDVSLHAPVVFAGYGITAPELNYDDYASLDAKGKVVLVFDHEPQENDPKSIFNGTGNTRYATSRVKVLNAQAHAAVAVLLVAEPNRKHPTNAERSARIASSQDRGRITSQVIGGDEVQIPLYTISDIVLAQLLPDASAVQSAIDAALKPQSKALPAAEVELASANSERRHATTANVIGIIEGADSTLKNEYIIFSAHHDHDGVGTSGAIYHGADDNGSGTVGVVELARAFHGATQKPRRTLIFAVFAAEERGLLGSYYYVQNPLFPLAATKAVINFDMIGRDEAPSDQTTGLMEIAKDTTNEINLIGTKYSPDYRTAVERANKNVGLNLNYKWDEDSALNVYFRSDQFPFVLKNIPAMWWFTGFHPDYHMPTDTVEKIDFPKMEKILKLAYQTGMEFATNDKTPKFIPNPAAGR
jgi:hypothetical protein